MKNKYLTNCLSSHHWPIFHILIDWRRHGERPGRHKAAIPRRETPRAKEAQPILSKKKFLNFYTYKLIKI
jgi:hypothetical protein